MFKYYILHFPYGRIHQSINTIEQSPTVDISIAEEEEKLKDIIKPYKLLFNFEEGLKGTTDSDEIDQLLKL